jgi:hypothetical protein
MASSFFDDNGDNGSPWLRANADSDGHYSRIDLRAERPLTVSAMRVYYDNQAAEDQESRSQGFM